MKNTRIFENLYYANDKRPKAVENLVVHVKGLNIAKTDKWGTNQLGAFVTQLVSRGGFYNENREWIGLEKEMTFDQYHKTEIVM